MNLAEIIASVKAITDHDPELSTYDQEVRNLLNEVYAEMVASQQWRWSTQDVSFPIHGPVNMVLTLTNGSRDAVIVSGTPADWMRWAKGVISETVSVDICDIDFAVTTLYLVSPWSGVTGNYTVSVREYEIPLPRDCNSVLLFHSDEDDQDYFENLPKHADDYFGKNRIQTPSAPEHFVLCNPRPLEAPIDTFTLTPVDAIPTARPSIAPGTYDICYSYEYRGAESSLSDHLTVTIGGPAVPGATPFISMQFAGLTPRGLIRRVYARRSGTSAWYRCSAIPTDFPFIDLFGDDVVQTQNDWAIRRTRYFPASDTNYIRFSPVQDADRNLIMRYLRAPQPLEEPGDAPIFPSAHHIWLRHATLAELYVRHHDMSKAKHYEDLAKKVLDQIRGKDKVDNHSLRTIGNTYAGAGFGGAVRLPKRTLTGTQTIS